MRRLFGSAIPLAIVSAVAVLPLAPAWAVPPPPPPYVVMVYDNGFGCAPVPYQDHPAPLNQNVTYIDHWPGDTTVEETHGFWSLPMSNGGDVDYRMQEAGTFGEKCAGGSVWSLQVLPGAPASTSDPTFRVRWATPNSAAGHVYSVQFKVGSNGAVKNWRVENPQKNAVFPGGHHGHTYFFRAESFIDHDHHSDWSPWARVVVR